MPSKSKSIGPMRLTVEIEATNCSTAKNAVEAILAKMKQLHFPEKDEVFQDPGFKDSPHRKVLEEAGFEDKPHWKATITKSGCFWEE